MFPNAKASELVAILGAINPASQGAGTANSGWISAQLFHSLMAVVQIGALGGSATVDAKIQQATDSSGTGAKDVSNKAIVQHTTGNNKQQMINLRTSELDVSNGFDYVQFSITVGTAATLIAGLVLGVNPRFAPASDNNSANVTQNVN